MQGVGVEPNSTIFIDYKYLIDKLDRNFVEDVETSY